VLRRREHITTAASSGKLTTALLTAAALLYVADGPRSGRPALFVAMIPFSLSFFQYGRRFLRLIQHSTS
jgi:CDP-diacylglycerol--glycerol-3-phosphate 3-phosphatidyltransferase